MEKSFGKVDNGVDLKDPVSLSKLFGSYKRSPYPEKNIEDFEASLNMKFVRDLQSMCVDRGLVATGSMSVLKARLKKDFKENLPESNGLHIREKQNIDKEAIRKLNRV